MLPRTHLLTSSLLMTMIAIFSGCKEEKQSRPPALGPVDLAAPVADVTTPDAAPDTPQENHARPDAKPKDIDQGKKLRQAYLTHLNEGRRLVKAKQYDAGIKELELALKSDPNDARVLSELGWAAFLAGDMERARQANSDSVRFAREDKLKAASLYNLGRVAEQAQDTSAAIDAYQRSLAMRPDNATVQKRLDALQGTAIVLPSSDACQLERYETTSPHELCVMLKPRDAKGDPCRIGDHPNAEPLEQSHFDTPGTGFEGLDIIAYTVPDDYTTYYTLAAHYQGAMYAVSLPWAYNPGAFGIYESLTQPTISLEQLMDGDPRQIVFRITHQHHDTDMGIDEEEDISTTHTLILGLVGGKPTLLASFAERYTYERDRMGLAEGDDQIEADLQTPGLPIKEESSSTLKFDGHGKLTLVTTPSHPRGMIDSGTYALGDGALRSCLTNF